MEIGTIFTLDQYAEAYAYAVANNCKIEEIAPVTRVVSEEYEEIIDEPEHEVVVKTREVEKEVRQYQIVEIPEPPEPTVEEKNELIRKTRASLYAELIDPLHAEKQRKVVLGTWTEANEAEYIAEVKRQTLIIQTDNPYIE